MQHKKKFRTIPIVPECQQILMPYLLFKEESPEAYLFTPADAVQLIHIEKRRNRKTPVPPSQQNRSREKKYKRPLHQRRLRNGD
jgi:hypothetical protein